MQLRIGQVLLADDLRRLGEIGAKGQLAQVPAQIVEQLDGDGLVDGGHPPVFKKGELGEGQQLALGRQG